MPLHLHTIARWPFLSEASEREDMAAQAVLEELLALNAVIYILLILEAMRRTKRRVRATNLAEAFMGLELALKDADPDLPKGFTWGEAVARLQSLGIRTQGMDAALNAYEDYRYGGSPLPDLDFQEVVKVANGLGGIRNPRGTGVGR